MAEITVTLTKGAGPVVSLRAGLAECSDAIRLLGLLMPGLHLAGFLDRADVEGGVRRGGATETRGARAVNQ